MYFNHATQPTSYQRYYACCKQILLYIYTNDQKRGGGCLYVYFHLVNNIPGNTKVKQNVQTRRQLYYVLLLYSDILSYQHEASTGKQCDGGNSGMDSYCKGTLPRFLLLCHLHSLFAVVAVCIYHRCFHSFFIKKKKNVLISILYRRLRSPRDINK